MSLSFLEWLIGIERLPPFPLRWFLPAIHRREIAAEVGKILTPTTAEAVGLLGFHQAARLVSTAGLPLIIQRIGVP